MLEMRVEDLSRALRIGMLDERFHFLPYGLVLALREMLADGRITAWEREHLLKAVDEDRVLTRSQRKTVKEQIEAWFKRDQAQVEARARPTEGRASR